MGHYAGFESGHFGYSGKVLHAVDGLQHTSPSPPPHTHTHIVFRGWALNWKQCCWTHLGVISRNETIMNALASSSSMLSCNGSIYHHCIYSRRIIHSSLWIIILLVGSLTNISCEIGGAWFPEWITSDTYEINMIFAQLTLYMKYIETYSFTQNFRWWIFFTLTLLL